MIIKIIRDKQENRNLLLATKMFFRASQIVSFVIKQHGNAVMICNQMQEDQRACNTYRQILNRQNKRSILVRLKT